MKGELPMKMRSFLICVAVFFVVVLLLGRTTMGTHLPDRIEVSFALTLALGAVGGVIAAVSLFSLLQRSLAGQALEQNLALLIALLGGLLLYQANWGTSLALGMVATAVVVTHYLGGPKTPTK
jgi:NhaP-type Na+/H+ or K+/H+ antiporter